MWPQASCCIFARALMLDSTESFSPDVKSGKQSTKTLFLPLLFLAESSSFISFCKEKKQKTVLHPSV